MAARDEQLIEVLGVLAEGVRFKILSVIASKGELTAKDILENFDFTQPTLSHHMASLTKAGLVIVKRKGRYAYYSINKDTIDLVASGIDSLKNPSKTSVAEKKAKRKELPAVTEDTEKLKKGKKKKKKDKSKKKKKD
ncbi:MAG: metalloregulator ArsR/SmtB family transcription factor [Saccharofermentans sp.]|nr:metalloregulator ArsR/SmtB family transcription factor [Saccharofermentans sp.]